ncbi:MAG: tetratricopeptide repeat protein [Treponema sp.]|nr:tetratricopeptide repeat protein [Treponema sp.]
MKETLLGVFVLLIIAVLGFMVYRYEHGKTHRDLAKKITELSPKGGPPESIEGLREAIAAYEAQIELNVKEGAQTGVYWKILAVRLADKGMHRDALDALERAIYYTADDPTLFYLTGVSAGITAKADLDFPGSSNRTSNGSSDGPASQDRYFALSESAYKRSIELDESYAKPRYGLGVLYTFDLNRPAEAIPHLERYLELMSSDLSGMFALARAYYMTENYEGAIDLYDRILTRTKDAKIKEQAQENKDFIMGQIYG